MFFFFNDTATTEIYTLSLHDALPISWPPRTPTNDHGEYRVYGLAPGAYYVAAASERAASRDRKSTRLNSSHQIISYAVFCLKKKKQFDRLMLIVGLSFLILSR